MKKLVVGCVAALVCATLATGARAQVATEVQGSVTAAVGVTSNVNNTQVPTLQSQPQPAWDGYGSVTPGIQLSFETPRTTHTLSYVFDYHYYFVHNEANAISNSLGYGFSGVLGPTANLTLGVTGSQTQISAFNIVAGGQHATVAATAAGNNYLVTGVANQALNVALSELNTFSEGLAFTASDTLPVTRTQGVRDPQQQTYVASNTLALTHEFKRDRLGGELGNDVLIFPDQTALTPQTNKHPKLTVTQAQHIDVIHRATLNWHHDYNPDWSSTLSAGPLIAYQATETKDADGNVLARSPAVQPTGGASIDYANERGTAGLAYAHAAQPNLILQQMSLVDTVTLRGGLPLWGSGFDLSGAAALLASRNFLASGGFSEVTYGALIDAAIGWQRPTLPLRFEVRYQFSRQFGIGDPGEGQTAVPDIRRQNAQFSITYFFPHAPQVGQQGPSLVAIPSPGSNPDILSRQTETRGQQGDRDRQEMHDRKEKGGKDGGGSGSSGGSETGGGESKGGGP